ncbi:hypothetical protein ACQ33O_09530 [Ferruginibacter sp. SUN002]|uniref:hypothetical protein n=1 Tax=Ferruginibacter sp. SUN002 TaxID=2937789 RepID=UPI003D362D58
MLSFNEGFLIFHRTFTFINIRIIITTFLLLLFNRGIAQITWDTTQHLSRHEGGYGTFKPSVKASITYDGNIGFEIARVRNSLSLIWLLNNTTTKYYGINWKNNHNYKHGLFGITAGGDIDFLFLHLGLGAIAQTDFQKLKFYVLPNVGLSWFGTVGIYYGTKIKLANSNDFIGNNNYIIGVKYNFTKDLMKEFSNASPF